MNARNIRTEIETRLLAGETVEAIAAALSLDVVEDERGQPMVALPGWQADDGHYAITVFADSSEEAARGYVDGGDWGDHGRTIWIHVVTWRVGLRLRDDAAIACETDRESHRIAVEPEVPDCADGQDHDWASPHEIVGGLAENPGVWGHGGGVVSHSVCLRCGCGCTVDTWAQDPTDGQQGMESTSYEVGKYSADLARRRDAEQEAGQ